MNNILVLCLMIFLIISCNNLKETDNEKLVSIDDKEHFPVDLLDSLLSDKIYNLKYEAIQSYSAKYLIDVASEKNNLSTEEYIKIFVTNKLKKFIAKSDSNLSIKSKNELRMFIQKNLIDSLKNQLDFLIMLKPEYPRKINQDSIQYFSLNEYSSDKQIIYIISDFECGVCYVHFKEITQIVKDYNTKIHFRFVYYGNYTDPRVYFLLSEKVMPNNSTKIISNLFELYHSIDSNDLSNYISQFSLEFNSRMFLESTKKMMKNNIFLSENIYSTPTYIFNNMIYDQKGNLDILKNSIY